MDLQNSKGFEKFNRPLTELLLKCWQREYDRRPYCKLTIRGREFESKMRRRPTEDDFAIILNFIRNSNKLLETFELLYTPLEYRDIESFVELISQLKNVSLVHVDLPAEVLQCLFKKHSYCRINNLHLTGNYLTREHANYLKCFLVHNKNLKYLNVGFCSLTLVTFTIIAEGVQKSSSLKGIDMSCIVPENEYSHVDSMKLGTIIAMLLCDSQLEEVHFKQNRIDCYSIEPLCEYLTDRSCLKYLDLSSNCIGSKGASILFDALQKCPSLIALDLSNNQLRDPVADTISMTLPYTKVRFLDLRGNHISESILCTIRKYYAKEKQTNICFKRMERFPKILFGSSNFSTNSEEKRHHIISTIIENHPNHSGKIINIDKRKSMIAYFLDNVNLL